MRRVLLAGLLLAGTLSLAGEKGGPLVLRVKEQDGTAHQGRAQLKKETLEVETLAGTKKLPWSRVAEIEEIDPDAPPPEIERTRDRATFADRTAALEKKTDEPRALAHQWTSLGEWARKHGLSDEAKQAFEKAATLFPDDAEAERALGRAKDENEWRPVREVFEKKKTGLPPGEAGLYELARFAAKNGLDDEAVATVAPLAEKNAFDKALLAFLRPITDRHRQASAIGFPLRGRFKASQDPSHHHEMKTYAVYAIDFYGDVDGKNWKGDGKELTDHFIWGAPVYAVAAGRVYGSTDGFPDNPVFQVPPGDLQMKANGVGVVHSNGEASWYLHLQKGSVRVKIGDEVKKGDVLGLVGNSGASAQPHLHFTLADRHKISIPWACEGWTLVAPDGSKVLVKRGRVVEGQVAEAKD